MDASKQEITGFPEAVCRKAMRIAILSACFGAISQVLVASSSVIILYANMLGADEFVALCAASLQRLALCILFVPLAHVMRHAGKKRLIVPVTGISAVALLAAAGAGWMGSYAIGVFIAGISVFSVGIAVYIVGWFPLLRDIVPSDERGRFFGRLRVSWQFTTAVFLTIAALLVKRYPSIVTLQVIIAFAAVGLLGRMVLLPHIPERPSGRTSMSFRKGLSTVLANQSLVGFGVYLFWLYFFAGATIPVSVLMAKTRLHMSNDFLVLLSACMMGAAILGFFLGGRLVDRLRGTKKVFLISHLGFGFLNLAMLFVQDGSTFCMALLAVITVLYGMLLAASSIAVSSEAFALVTEDVPELSLAVCLGLHAAGFGLSSFLAGWVLNSGMLSESWTCFGLPLTQYHTVFLGCGIGVIITSALLVMVPAIIAPRQSLPQVR